MKTNSIPQVERPVTSLCVGTSPLGGHMGGVYGADVDDARAAATIEQALDSPIRFLDTSNAYGESERRIGDVIRRRGLPADVVLATKADPSGRDFSGRRVIESFEESSQRLGLPDFDIFYLHDPEKFEFGDLTAPGGAVDSLLQLKNDGRVRAIGVAGGDLDVLRRFVDLGVFDVVLNHNRYTLLDRSADPFIDEVLATGAAFVNAAPYASGLLAKPDGGSATYKYAAPDDSIRRSVAAVADLCRTYGVSLPAAALQFSTRDARISSTVVGMSRPERVDELIRNDQENIPDEFWTALDEQLQQTA